MEPVQFHDEDVTLKSLKEELRTQLSLTFKVRGKKKSETTE